MWVHEFPCYQILIFYKQDEETFPWKLSEQTHKEKDILERWGVEVVSEGIDV